MSVVKGQNDWGEATSAGSFHEDCMAERIVVEWFEEVENPTVSQCAATPGHRGVNR